MAHTIDLLASEFSHVPLRQEPRVRWPNLRALAQPFLGRQYVPHDCWKLVCELLHAGGFVQVPSDPYAACRAVHEVWWQGDPRDPLLLLQPWDWLLFPYQGPAVQHPGLVVDSLDFIHVHRKAGVTIEPIRRHRERLIQVARLHCLS